MARWIPTKRCVTCGKEFEKPYYISRRDWEKRLYCTRACKHIAQTGRPNPKASAAKRGKPASSQAIEAARQSMLLRHAAGTAHRIDNTGLRGPETSQWKGDDISYRTAHARLYAQNGRPEACEHCGRSDGRLEWALKRDASIVKIQEGGRSAGRHYSPRPEDYFPLCSGCHVVYDERQRTADGRFT